MNKTRIKQLEKIVDDIYERYESAGTIKYRWLLPFNVYIGKKGSTCIFCPNKIEYGEPKVYTRNGSAHIECVEREIIQAKRIKDEILSAIKNNKCKHPIDKIKEKHNKAICQECGLERRKIIDFSMCE